MPPTLGKEVALKLLSLTPGLQKRGALRTQGIYGSQKELGRGGQLRAKFSLLMSYVCRQNFTDAKFWHKANPTGAYRNFGSEELRGHRWEPEAHSEMPKVAETRLSTARSCVCEQGTAGPSDPMWT